MINTKTLLVAALLTVASAVTFAQTPSVVKDGTIANATAPAASTTKKHASHKHTHTAKKAETAAPAAAVTK